MRGQIVQHLVHLRFKQPVCHNIAAPVLALQQTCYMISPQDMIKPGLANVDRIAQMFTWKAFPVMCMKSQGWPNFVSEWEGRTGQGGRPMGEEQGEGTYQLRTGR